MKWGDIDSWNKEMEIKLIQFFGQKYEKDKENNQNSTEKIKQ